MFDEEMRRRFEQMNAGNRSRFYRDNPSNPSPGATPEPPPRSAPQEHYELTPVATPGVNLEAQQRALEVLRAQAAHFPVGQSCYFHGDRINLFDQGFFREPPLLAGKLCVITHTGFSNKGLARVPWIKVKGLECWIDAAYFGEKPPLITATPAPHRPPASATT